MRSRGSDHFRTVVASCMAIGLVGCTDSEVLAPYPTETSAPQDAGADAAEDAAPDAEADAEPSDGGGDFTKWNPGHYIRISGNDPLPRVEQILDEPYVRGAALLLTWSDLEPSKDSYDFSVIEGALDLLRPAGKHLFLQIQERAFGGDCSTVPIPEYLKLEPEYDGGCVAMTSGSVAKFWDEDVLARLVALYQQLGNRWDGDATFEGVITPESAVAVADPDQRPTRELLEDTIKALATGLHSALPHTNHIINMNWLGGSTTTVYMEEVAQHVADLGSGGVGNPDTVPCRFYGTCTAGHIPVYDVHLAYQGLIAIGPSAQTAQLDYDETEAVFDLAVNVFEANYVFWEEEFWSKDDGFIAGYLDNQVLPTLAAHQGAISTTCPTSLVPCSSP